MTEPNPLLHAVAAAHTQHGRPVTAQEITQTFRPTPTKNLVRSVRRDLNTLALAGRVATTRAPAPCPTRLARILGGRTTYYQPIPEKRPHRSRGRRRS